MTTKIEEIKVDGIEMVQRNHFEKKQAREMKVELAERKEKLKKEIKQRNKKAKAYSRKCKIKDIIGATLIGVVCAGALTAMVSCSQTEPRYAIASEQGNGIHYTYVTERKCVVTEVTDTLVTVEYKGNLYSFYSHNTELEVGDEVICKFTDNWKIVGTK